MLDSVSIIDNFKFQRMRISINCMLDNEPITPPLYIRKVFKKWSDIFSPEYKAIYTFRSKVYPINLLVIGVYHLAIASLHTVHKPFPIESWYICFITG